MIEKYADLCRANSYELQISSNAKIIEEMLEAENFDIILLDNDMPEGFCTNIVN